MLPYTPGMPAAALPSLDQHELLRYGRHLTLPEIGLDGQRRLKAARVLLVGAGGLGSPAALYLAAAGIGTIGIVDFDRVDATNLQRQVLYGTGDVGRAKTTAARERLTALNPHVTVETHDVALTADNALDLLARYDIVLDGTDNFRTRYLTNDACVLLGVPNVHGSVLRFEGQASVFAPPDGPCYRCLFPEPPPPGVVPSCAEAGVLGVLPGLVGVIQATETIKLVLGIGDTLLGRLLLIDALHMRFRAVAVRRDPACPACGTRAITTLVEYDDHCIAPATTTTVAEAIPELAPRELAERRRRGDDLELIDVREPHEWTIARIDGARLLPLSRFDLAAESLDRDREFVLYCHHGMRSLAAAEHLRDLGFRRVWNLAGGIARWSEDVDPSVPRY